MEGPITADVMGSMKKEGFETAWRQVGVDSHPCQLALTRMVAVAVTGGVVAIRRPYGTC